MKNSKLTRLLMGMIILFSIFLFQGTDDLGGCSSCNGEQGGSLTIINNVFEWDSLFIMISGPTGDAFDLDRLDSKVVYVDEGLYQILAMYWDRHADRYKLHKVRVVEIKLGSQKTITITD
jgi:hypothetical protein